MGKAIACAACVAGATFLLTNGHETAGAWLVAAAIFAVLG
jgi:hypothetical protein